MAIMPAGYDPATWREAVRDLPGGIVRVRQKQIVARLPVEPYQVMPKTYGLSQLVGSGAVVRMPDLSFRIVRPIPRLPPGLFGGHSVKLYVAKGVPIPPGDTGHSCLFSEEKNRALVNAERCKTDDRKMIRAGDLMQRMQDEASRAGTSAP